jgi:hypothetical protein
MQVDHGDTGMLAEDKDGTGQSYERQGRRMEVAAAIGWATVFSGIAPTARALEFLFADS